MPPVSTQRLSQKPLAGLCVVLFLSIVIGGWLYVDNTRNELEAKIETLSSLNENQKALPTTETVAESGTSQMAAFNGGGFAFTYPARLGSLRCQETGAAFFGYDIEKLGRTWATDGPSFRYEFWKAKPLPDNADAKPFQALLLSMDPVQAGGPSCWISLADGTLKDEEAFRLLKSVQVK